MRSTLSLSEPSPCVAKLSAPSVEDRSNVTSARSNKLSIWCVDRGPGFESASTLSW